MKTVNKICSCCGYKRTDFYVNQKTGRANKYCRECETTFTPKERKEQELKWLVGIMTDINITDKLKDKE
jgi:hypothetical protein